jgi:hypothetical protein
MKSCCSAWILVGKCVEGCTLLDSGIGIVLFDKLLIAAARRRCSVALTWALLAQDLARRDERPRSGGECPPPVVSTSAVRTMEITVPDAA